MPSSTYAGQEGRERMTIAVEASINIASNALLNALCAWLIWRGAQAVPCDLISVLIDTCITCLFVCLITTPFCVAAAKRHLTSGALARREPGKISPLARLPRRTFPLALALALCAMVLLGLLFGSAFALSGTAALPVEAFVAYKGVWGGLLGGCVCSLVLVRQRLLPEG